MADCETYRYLKSTMFWHISLKMIYQPMMCTIRKNWNGLSHIGSLKKILINWI